MQETPCPLLQTAFPGRMAKLVLLHKTDSIYDDVPESVYDFPAPYLRAIREAVGDWAVYYEPVKAGPRGYFAVARIEAVVPKPAHPGRYLARIEPGSFLAFVDPVPRIHAGRTLESALAEVDGTPRRGGAVQLAVRRLPEGDFARIVNIGLPPDLEAAEARRYGDMQGIDDPAASFQRPVIERLTRRPYREAAFRHNVRAAYDFRCAMSGLRLQNGGGRPEVQAAHIRPVERGGSDAVQNGLALSGTLHWMFDRGLVSVAEDLTILVSRNKVPADVIDRLILPGGRLHQLADRHNRPHPTYLRWHRENVFGQTRADEPTPWG
jgi:putative restriction endonuclease